ncbi:aldehyde dehydrogenase [Roseimicrobium gellanilyticum]|nr:aldehyde dehydrogenase [Roseimicrobium gellanilyticum]
MDLTKIVQSQKNFFRSGVTRPTGFRQNMLSILLEGLSAHGDDLLKAVYRDLGRSPEQTYLAEVAFVESEAAYAMKHIGRWAKPRRVPTPVLAWPARSSCQQEPYGVVLIMGPWNYPLQLILTPLVSAIAAGNCAVLKPSELSPATSEAIARLVSSIYPPEYVAVVEGDGVVAAACLKQPFQKIFFTGSTERGREVMACAADRLIPVTLELGGKSPCIVCADVPIEIAARRIVWGKFLNAGQTCTAPDFVLVDRRVKEQFLESLSRSIKEFYGEDPRRSADYSRIINRRHHERLVGYLASGETFYGGHHEASDLYISPTILTNVSENDPVLQEEIFGPILPVATFDEIAEAISYLRSRPTPLAMYLFTEDKETQDAVLREVRSGGVCVNDTLLHMMGKCLPFGGLGQSGMGMYHGKYGFECFSHQRAVMNRGFRFDSAFRYPPMKTSLTMLKKAGRFLLGR